MRVVKRIPFYTNPCKRLPPKIPNPLPKTAGAPIDVGSRCLFYDLRAKAAPPPTLFAHLPPLIKNTVGRFVDADEVQRMRELRQADPERWTITALSSTFNIHRSFVIRRVLSAAEQKQEVEELAERIDGLSLKRKRGWLMRFKIREHRRDIW